MSDIILEQANKTPSISRSKSIIDLIQRAPGTAISSIAALFIVIILSIVIPLLFAPCKSS